MLHARNPLKQPPMMMKKLLLVYALLGLTGPAFAQVAPAAPSASSATTQKESGFLLDNINAKDREKGIALGQSLSESLLNSYQSMKDLPVMKGLQTDANRLADQIANKQMQAARDTALTGLGLNPNSNTALYYFVSWSMPLNMLRQYALEAMWDGGTLEFRGIPPGMTIGHFVLHDLEALIYGKGASANVSIDPRMFDVYDVKTVPTIVFTTSRENFNCALPHSVVYKKQSLQYMACPELSQNAYDKISGAVTSLYALQTFKDNGMTSVEPYLKALRKGYAVGVEAATSKEEVGFSGDWKNAMTPEQLQEAFTPPGQLFQSMKQPAPN